MNPVKVTAEHRRKAYRMLNGCEPPGEHVTQDWLRDGIDGGPPLFQHEALLASNLAHRDALESLSDLIFTANPLGWVAAGDMEGAQEWEKRSHAALNLAGYTGPDALSRLRLENLTKKAQELAHLSCVELGVNGTLTEASLSKLLHFVNSVSSY